LRVPGCKLDLVVGGGNNRLGYENAEYVSENVFKLNPFKWVNFCMAIYFLSQEFKYVNLALLNVLLLLAI